jgi:hypothetical protein
LTAAKALSTSILRAGTVEKASRKELGALCCPWAALRTIPKPATPQRTTTTLATPQRTTSWGGLLYL